MDKMQLVIWFAFGVVSYEVGTWVLPSCLRWLRNWQSSGRSLKLMQLPLSKFETVIDPVLEQRKPHEIWNMALFFPEDPTLPNKSPQAQFLYYFENVKVSIHMSMHLSSLFEIRDIILKKMKEEGIVVKIITDFDTISAHNNGNCKVFVRAGVQVRARNTGSLMHHKFVIFDNEALMTGSLNQTKHAFLENYENVVITTNPRIVESYREEFRQMWLNMDDVNISMFPHVRSQQNQRKGRGGTNNHH